MRHAIFALVVTLGAGCSGNAQSQDPRQALAGLSGRYTVRADGDFQYSQQREVEKIVAAQPRAGVVPALVNCLDDITPSKSELDGKPVAVGIVCYEALSNLVYYEPTTATWAGYITPRATPQQMRAAKAAWTRVVADKAFSFQ